jgi:acyl transferase domain-containing protein/acyl carrier protein
MKTHQTRSEYIKRWMSRGDDAAGARLQKKREQPIAVVGMDGVFPNCGNVTELWQSLIDETVLYDSYPASFLHTRPDKSDGGSRIAAGLIESALQFDPEFFKISLSEAELMDPQLRHLLMSTHRSMEDAGYTAGQLSTRRVGVFIGSEGSEYNELHREAAAAAGYSLHQAGCSLANRLSYQFDFKGPSEVIDTQCSSGAYCIYRAMQLLRSAEIDVAIVGAVKLHFSERTFQVLNGLKMTSASRCYSFHRQSAGYIRSEGVVTLVLKTADAALRDKDYSYANILEAAMTYNGRDGNSMFTPGKRGQKEAMLQCVRRAGIRIADIACVEAQGMGNEISDFVELSAINEACEELVREEGLAAGEARRYPLISTLKPVLGHMECVSALGALLKIVLSFRTRTLYRIPGLRREDISEKLDVLPLPCELLTAHRQIDSGQTMRAGLNSFGASGTNVHLLLEEPGVAQAMQPGTEAVLTEQLLVVSARSQRGLLRYVTDIQRYLRANGAEVRLDSLCCAFQLNRDHYPHRAMFPIPKVSRAEQIRSLTESLDRYLGRYLEQEQRTGGGGGPFIGDQTEQSDLIRDGLAWLDGAAVDWSRHHPQANVPYKMGGLPTYPFDVKPCRLDVKPAAPLPPGIEVAATGSVRQIIVATLAKSLKKDADEISNDTPFADYGVDSVQAVNLVRTLNESLGIELQPTDLFDHSTVNRLSTYITSQSSSPLRVVANTGQVGKEPIAIIGMSGRFGGCETLDEFWESLRDGKSLVREVTRWPAQACVAKQGHCTQGSFIDSIDRFDPFFFNISALEALYMDPQQRLFLEESWKALEDAGYAGKSMEGRRCGVYAGCNFVDYTALFDADPPEQAFWGVAGCVIPARIAYYLNLLGPAVMVDTACSSSLVAIHTACQGLWCGETEMALAGAVFLQVTPMFFQYSNRAGMLSPRGRCAAFDADADGFVPGEGVGVVVLKRLKDALRDGDSIHGVIAGSAINQDGKTNGITAPSARSQEELECSVYDSFDINPETLQVVEAHGTGTKLGDPIELGALQRAFARYTGRRRFCAVGSVKTNIGHAAAAAGMAGVLKLLLALKQRQIPPSLNFKTGNPLIDFESSPFYVNTHLQEWQAPSGAKRRAAISSFGFSGTNAHMVIEEAPVREASVDQPAGHLIVLSACTFEQLKEQAENLLAFARKSTTLSMSDIAYTLLVGRMHRSHRLTCIAHSRAEMIELLERWMKTGACARVGSAEIQEGKLAEQASLKSRGERSIRECGATQDAGQRLAHLATVADLYLQGYELDFQPLFPQGSRRISLPSYPFARERYWLDRDNLKPAPPAADGPDASLESIDDLVRQIDEGSIEAAEGVQRIRALAAAFSAVPA